MILNCEKIIQDFISFAKANGYTISDDDASKVNLLCRSIKMEIVRLLKNDDAAQVTALSEDPVVLQ